MAKAKAKIVEDGSNVSYIDKLIQDQFEEAIVLSKVDTKVDTWYDIGVYVLNYAMSKKLRAGIPGGRISAFDGLSSTGKSLLVSSAMKDPQVEKILIIESEGGGNSKELLDFAEVDTDKVVILKHNTFACYRISKKNANKIEEVSDKDFPVVRETEDWLYKEGMNRALKRFIYGLEIKGIKPKIMIVLDSIGNMQSVRELTGVQDVGAKQKDIAAFFRTFDNSFERTNIAFLFTNKVYTNMMDPYNPIKETGGVNVMFNPSVYMRLTTMSDTEDVSDTDMKSEKDRRTTSLGSSFKSVRAKIIKSRFGTEHRNAWFLIDFSIGPVKYSGLFTLLKDFGIIKKNGASYSIDGWNNDKSFYKKDFIQIFSRSENESVDLFQKLLNEAEKSIKEKRRNLYVNDLSDVKESEDPDITGLAADDSGFGDVDTSEIIFEEERKEE